MSFHKGRQKKESKSLNLRVVKEKQKLWFQNLIILKFPCTSMAEKYKMTFHCGMFDKPNKAGFEIICHYLFTKLDKAKSTELFRLCYPVSDKKACQQFRTVCLNWWKRLSEEHPRFNFPRVTNTLLMSPTGAEVYKILFYFSNFVLFMESRRLDRSVNGKGQESTILPPDMKQTIEGLNPARVIALKIAAHSESVKMMHTMQISKQSDLEANKLASSMLDEYRDNVKLKKHLEQKKKELLSKLHIPAERLSAKGTPSRSHSVPQTPEKFLLLRTNNSEATVRKLWKNLLTAVENTHDEREIVQSILNMNGDTKGLNAAELAPKVPAILLQQCTNKVYKSVGTSLYEAGQLNLCGLMKLFNLSLHLLIEKLHEVGVPNFEGQLPYIKAQSHICEENIKSLNTIRKKLNENAPETAKKIKKLTSRVDDLHRNRERSRQESSIAGLPKPMFQSSEIEEDNCNDNTDDLGILPLTPPFQFSDHAVPTPSIFPKNKDIPKEKLYNFVLPGDLPSVASEVPSTIESTSNHEDINKSDTSLKQGALEIALSTSPKTLKKADKPVESLLRKRMLKQNFGRSSGLPRPANKNLIGGTKPSSVPSTPVAKKIDTTIEKVTSRTPEAVRNLVNQVVDYTMLEMSVQPGYKPSDTSPVITGLTPTLLDISSQLDMTVFETQNRIGRTPPGIFNYNSPSTLVPETVNPVSEVQTSSTSLVKTKDSPANTESENISEDNFAPLDDRLLNNLRTPCRPLNQTFPTHMQYATPGNLKDINYTQCPNIMDIRSPECNISDSSFDSLNTAETPDSLNTAETPGSPLPDVPIGNLIDF
uniref:HAUS augmin-like complex subunit 6 isoform X1 n=1 Tax=Styela clava TaxID=7725 RepID=UPI001939BDD8|nr:HAUS augmin-like complex subunit 6 isoform X1 [Styela clava]